jgi:hypothetical protein
MNQDRLTIVNCGSFHTPQVAAEAYACPAAGKNGAFENNQYLGLCWHRAVRHVGQVRGVVDINPQTGLATVVWNNEQTNGLTDAALVQHARERLLLMFPNEESVQRVFVLGGLFETNFVKPTSRGMQYRKTYRSVAPLQPTSAQDLAMLLDGREWSDLPR